jgi:hypothetical protein
MSEQSNVNESNIFEMVLHSAMKFPGIKVSRSSFLRKELSKYFDEDVVEKAIKTNPAQAGISNGNLEQLAKACINYETTKVTAISAAAGIPGGLAMVGTVPADLAQFFGHIIRVLQKLIYLYGWQELFHDEDDGLDDATSNQLTLFIGVMFGVNAANAAISKIAMMAAKQAEKTLIKKALSKGTIFPIVKAVARLIGVKMTKQLFARGVGKIIPVVGAVVSGGITFIGFKPMANRLQKHLITLPLSSVDYYKKTSDDANSDEIIDVDFSDIVVEDIDSIDKLNETDEHVYE